MTLVCMLMGAGPELLAESDIDEMALAIQAWKAKETGGFDALVPVLAV